MVLNKYGPPGGACPGEPMPRRGSRGPSEGPFFAFLEYIEYPPQCQGIQDFHPFISLTVRVLEQVQGKLLSGSLNSHLDDLLFIKKWLQASDDFLLDELANFLKDQ